MKNLQNNFDSAGIIKSIKSKNSNFWIAQQKKKSLELFHKTSKNVPAYKNFLKKHTINPHEIKKWEDLSKVPSTNKKNYLREYSLNNLSFDGNLKKPLVFTSTSGSTGEPFYFHRSFALSWQSSVVHELFYLQGQYKKDEPVLVIVCFGMGAWIGGLITYQAFNLMQERGYNISLITPGINKYEIFKALKNIGSLYKKIILAGYPPFIKDIVDEAPFHDIDWKKFNVRFIFAAETFNEDFRKYILRAMGVKNSLLDTMNIYGTADLGSMAFETPLTILIRRLCSRNNKLFKSIFNEITKTPTLCQYIPSFTSFDFEGKNLIVSGENTMPLVRYSLGDRGGMCSFLEMEKRFKKVGIDLKKEIKKNKIEKFCYELPFVYVYEREDLAVKLYGATIYPEHIRETLLHPPLVNYLTGKFTIMIKFNKRHDQYMEVNCELKKEQKPSFKVRNLVKKMVTKGLIEKNAEYHNNFKSIPKKVEPHIILRPYEHPLNFKPGTKQKWVDFNISEVGLLKKIN